jgi:hypothetical protein
MKSLAEKLDILIMVLENMHDNEEIKSKTFYELKVLVSDLYGYDKSESSGSNRPHQEF